MIGGHYKWVKQQAADSSSITALVDQLQLLEPVANLLNQRGINTVEEAQAFLQPSAKTIHDPHLLHDMDKAVARIEKAIENGEQITVYGDYDADGITSTALMYEALQSVGAKVNYYIPDRFKDGYGPNSDAYQKIIAGGTSLIVTVDNGVSGKAVIDPIVEQGIDVVVTDHHEMPSELPNATAIVHPRYPGSNYPFPDLSGVGVAFKVAWALLDEFPEEMLDLVAIGEIADVVSVTDENRALISFGIQELRQGMRPGLHALIEASNAHENSLTSTDIAFTIAPRLNALGRVSNAAQGVALLTTLDEQEAKQLASAVEAANDQRRELVNEIMEAATPIVQQLEVQKSPTLIIFGHNWHQGVLGIIASRIVEQTGKPTIVASINDGEHIAKGSGRSVAGFDLFHALDGHRDLMATFGGHPAACGLSFAEDQLASLQQALNDEAGLQHFTGREKQPLPINGTLRPDQINEALYQQLMMVAPFGPGNEEPVFELTTDHVTDVRTMGQQHDHLKFKLGGVQVVAFNQGHLAPLLQAQSNGPIKIVVTISINEWRGQRSIQLMMKDLELAGPVVIDQRTNKLSTDLFEDAGYYIAYDHRLLANIKPHLPAGKALSADQAVKTDLTGSQVTLVDCPPSLTSLEELFGADDGAPDVIRLLLFQPHSIYLAGMPSRQDFANLYRFLYNQQKLNLNRVFNQMVQYLSINAEKLKYMIQVFSDAGFVTINDGILNLVKQHDKVDLKQTDHYLKMAAQYRAEKILLFSDSTDLAKWLFNSLDVK